MFSDVRINMWLENCWVYKCIFKLTTLSFLKWAEYIIPTNHANSFELRHSFLCVTCVMSVTDSAMRWAFSEAVTLNCEAHVPLLWCHWVSETKMWQRLVSLLLLMITTTATSGETHLHDSNTQELTCHSH